MPSSVDDTQSRDAFVIDGVMSSKPGIVRPKIMVVHPTERCNYRCPWCYYKDTNAGNELCLDALEGFLARNPEAFSTLEEVIVSGGGEPLLYSGFPKLVALLRRHAPRSFIQLNTNGSAIRNHVEALRQNVDYVRVSLDATTPEEHARVHGTSIDTWDAIYQGLAKLREACPSMQIGISMVEHRSFDSKELALLRASFDDIGLASFLVKQVVSGDSVRQESTKVAHDAGWAELEISERPTYQRDVCDAPLPLPVAQLLVHLDCDGGFYPCYHWNWYKQDKVGSLTSSNGDNYWNDGRYASGRTWARYCSEPHSCRIFDSWRAYRQTHPNKDEG